MTSDAQLVDRYLRLEAKVAGLKPSPLLSRLGEARTKLVARMESAPQSAGERIVLEGRIGRVEFGPRTVVRTLIDKAGLKAILGRKVFERLASFSLADIDRHTTPDQRETLLSSERTGYRPMKSIRTMKS